MKQIIAIAIVIISTIAIVTILKKYTKNPTKKKIIAISLIITFNICAIMTYLPIKFKTPEDAFKYLYFGMPIIEKYSFDNRTVFIYLEDKQLQISTYDKKDESWQHIQPYMIEGDLKSYKGCYILYKKPTEEDLVFTISCHDITSDVPKEYKITDSNNNEYKSIEIEDRKEYYGTTKRDNHIWINDEEIDIEKIKKFEYIDN